MWKVVPADKHVLEVGCCDAFVKSIFSLDNTVEKLPLEGHSCCGTICGFLTVALGRDFDFLTGSSTTLLIYIFSLQGNYFCQNYCTLPPLKNRALSIEQNHRDGHSEMFVTLLVMLKHTHFKVLGSDLLEYFFCYYSLNCNIYKILFCELFIYQ